jgi:hypothetical protein
MGRSFFLGALALTLGFAAGCRCSNGPADEGPAPPAAADAPGAGTATTATAQTRPAAPSSVAGAQRITRETLVPGELSVSVFASTFDAPSGPVPSWTYVSEGLWAQHQKEIAFSIKREPGEPVEAYPRAIFSMYSSIHAMAREGRLVDVNGFSRLGPSSTVFPRRADYRCVMYMRPESVPGIEVGAPFLSAVFVTCPELDLADALGYTRLQARLGLWARYYPAPPWTDLGRPELANPGEAKESLLTKTGRRHLSGASVTRERQAGAAAAGTRLFYAPGDRLVLRVLPRAADKLRETVAAKAAEGGVLLLLESDPGADSCLVSQPGQTEWSGISKPNATGDRLTGNFLLLAGGAEPKTASAYEDGFTMTFDTTTWKAVRRALAAGKPITIPGSDTVPAFVVEWISPVYTSPIDGTTYDSPEGWTQAFPGGVAPIASDSDASGVVLLTPEAEITQRTTVADLTTLVKRVIQVVEAEIAAAKGPEGSDLVVECEARPGREAVFRMAQRPAADRALTSAIHGKLSAIEIPVVTGPILFHVNFHVRGGRGSGSWIPAPRPQKL